MTVQCMHLRQNARNSMCLYISVSQGWQARGYKLQEARTENIHLHSNMWTRNIAKNFNKLIKIVTASYVLGVKTCCSFWRVTIFFLSIFTFSRGHLKVSFWLNATSYDCDHWKSLPRIYNASDVKKAFFS